MRKATRQPKRGMTKYPNDRRHDPPIRPETLQENNHEASTAGRGQLAHECAGHGQLAAKSQSDEEPNSQKHAEAIGQCAQPRRETVNEKGALKERLASKTVREDAGNRRSHEHTDEAGTDYVAHLVRVELPLCHQRRHHEADESHIHGIEQPAAIRT